jgi:hypothetical protein
VLVAVTAGLLGLGGVELGNAVDFGLSLAAVGFAALAGAVWLVAPLAARGTGSPHRVRVALIGVALVGVALARNLESWLTPLTAGASPGEQVIAWAATTPPGSTFLVPPNDPFSLEFLRRSGRPVFLVREGANHGLYFPEINREFARRLNALGIDNPLDFRARLGDAYEDLSADDVRAIARDFGVRYFIRPPGSRYPFPSALRVEGYVVYQVDP